MLLLAPLLGALPITILDDIGTLGPPLANEIGALVMFAAVGLVKPTAGAKKPRWPKPAGRCVLVLSDVFLEKLD
jgi:hypothetical protein